MKTVQTANITSKAHSGNFTIPANRNRSYLLIAMTSADGTVSFNGGDGQLPLSNGTHFEPRVCPTGEITVTTLGTSVVLMG